MGISTCTFDVLIFVALVLLGTYVYLIVQIRDFGKKVLCAPSYPVVGSLGPVIFRQKAFCEHLKSIYDFIGDRPYGGAFEFFKPAFVLKDPELIKKVTVKDFDHFVDRCGPFTEECDDMFGKSVFALEGQRWRDMRATLSPVFTASKMRTMFSLVSKCAKHLADHVMEHCVEIEAKKGTIFNIEMKELWSKYASDVIATANFGVQVDSLKNPENEFFETGKKISDFSGVQALIFFGYLLSRKLMKILRVPLIPWKAKKFLRDLVEQAITVRERDDIVRPDLIDLLMQARPGARSRTPPSFWRKSHLPDLDYDDIAAQVLVFYLAGFETTSTLLSFASNRLAVFEGVQRRLREEIDQVLAEEGGQITYDAVHRMKYLDMVISETLRLWPPIDVVDRRCVQRYEMPPSNEGERVVLEQGDSVWIPIYSVQRDPRHWPRPEVFDPERFSEENKAKVTPFTFLPFGAGPRNCIGMRFALMEVKVALVHLLSRFHLRRVERTPVDLVLSTNTFNITVDGGFWLGIEPRHPARSTQRPTSPRPAYA